MQTGSGSQGQRSSPLSRRGSVVQSGANHNHVVETTAWKAESFSAQDRKYPRASTQDAPTIVGG